MSVDGSLVTWRWGEDIVAHIKDAGGFDTDVIALDDLTMGIRAEYIEVLVTTRPNITRALTILFGRETQAESQSLKGGIKHLRHRFR